MKFLLDTNIWSYISDTNFFPHLFQASKRKGVEFLVAPASVTEVTHLGNPAIRKNILALMTNPRWKRLMPDTYLEAEEIKEAILSARPHWENKDSSKRDFLKFRHEFLRRTGGFWDKCRDEVPRPVTNESIREERENSLARQQVRDIRDIFKEKSQAEANTHLQSVTIEAGSPRRGQGTVEYWREATAYHLLSELNVYESPYSELLDCFIKIDCIYNDMEDFEELWFKEVEPIQLKRQWLRASMEYLQRWHKPTNGSPADSQLAVHAIDADYFVTADKNFARCLEKINAEAPFKTAKAMKVSASQEGLLELMQFTAK